MKRSLFVLILLALISGRFWRLDNPPFDHQSWRQADTAGMAALLADKPLQRGWLRPELYYEGPGPNVGQLELPVLPALAALGYKVFGEQYWFARTLAIAFFVGSVAFLYALAWRRLGPETAVVAATLYAAWPLTFYFSRAIMPEAVLLFFAVGSLYFTDRWAADNRWRDWVLAALFVVGTLITKPQAAVIGLPLLTLLVQRRGWSAVVDWRVWTLALVGLLVPAAYFWSLRGVDQAFVSGVVHNHLWGRGGRILLHPATWGRFGSRLLLTLTPVGALWAGLGLFFGKGRAFLLSWAGALLVYLALVTSVIDFDYYYVIFAPPAALAAGSLVTRLGRAWPLALAALGLVVWQGWMTISPWYQVNEKIAVQSQLVRAATEPEALLLLGSYSPEVLAGAQRYGWRYHIHTQTSLLHYEGVPDDPLAEIEYFRSLGATHFVPVKGQIWYEGARVLEYLENHYQKVDLGEYSIYDLRRPLGSGHNGERTVVCSAKEVLKKYGHRQDCGKGRPSA